MSETFYRLDNILQYIHQYFKIHLSPETRLIIVREKYHEYLCDVYFPLLLLLRQYNQLYFRYSLCI